jgi:hypothetical protein
MRRQMHETRPANNSRTLRRRYAPNALNRYPLGTRTGTLSNNQDGSLTIYAQSDPPSEAQRANLLPAPKVADFSLFFARLLAEDCDHKRLMDAARSGESEQRPMRVAKRHVEATERIWLCIKRGSCKLMVLKAAFGASFPLRLAPAEVV